MQSQLYFVHYRGHFGDIRGGSSYNVGSNMCNLWYKIFAPGSILEFVGDLSYMRISLTQPSFVAPKIGILDTKKNENFIVFSISILKAKKRHFKKTVFTKLGKVFLSSGDEH